jgi:hypothetical protein
MASVTPAAGIQHREATAPWRLGALQLKRDESHRKWATNPLGIILPAEAEPPYYGSLDQRAMAA